MSDRSSSPPQQPDRNKEEPSDSDVDLYAIILYIQVTILYIQVTILYIQVTILYIQVTILYIQINILYIQVTILYIQVIKSKGVAAQRFRKKKPD